MPDFGKAFEGDEPNDLRPVPSDDFEKYVNAQKRSRIADDEKKRGPKKPFEPRCHVCTHSYRDFIDSLLIKGNLSYSHIARTMPPAKNGRQLDHRQVSNHAKNHLGVGELAIRAILEEEAEQAAQDYEKGVRGAITHRGGLEVAFRKAFEDIVNGVASVEPRDMIAIGKLLRDWDTQTQETQIDLYKAQVHAIEEAIKEIVPREMWNQIANRARHILERDGVIGQLPESVPNEAAVVEQV